MKYTKEDILEISKNYTQKSEFKQREKKIYNIVRNRGWLKEICGHMKRKAKSPKTKEECHAVALRYKNYMEFYRKETKYFIYSKRNGWLKEIISHMPKRNIWEENQYEEVKSEALKYKNKHQFKKYSPKYHYAARKYGWLNEFYENV